MNIKVLATDLDGTLIPLPGNQQNKSDLQTLQLQLKQHGVTLLFVTGRSYSSAQQAIQEHDLPIPDWMICDVGTSIFKAKESADFERANEYSDHLTSLTKTFPLSELLEEVQHRSGLRFQEQEKQGAFKLSFYTEANELEPQVEVLQNWITERGLPYSVVSSHDPENFSGLIDILPFGVSKAYALSWWARRHDIKDLEIAFAGDSGNDLAALTAGYHAIIVSNAHPKVANEVCQLHHASQRTEQLFQCSHPASSGVLEALLHFTQSNTPGDKSKVADNESR